MWFLLFWACAANLTRTGLVQTGGSKVEITDLDGKTTRLVLEGEAKAIARLQGCLVHVSGQKVMSGLRVADWSVRDGGFGSQPFVGRMLKTPTGWVLDDRTTGSKLRIVDVGGGSPIHGSLVLINGLVVGQHQLALISVRTLLEPTEEIDASGP